ncbi:MAG: dTDP-4-dehydrorhamnose reductase [Bacilli bacterium]|nr:dTDP-4-dehydrorhamnose reductase [Bacilli bacterium]
MKSLVTGVSGQLGYDIVKKLKEQGLNDIFAPTSKEFDITNHEQVINYILEKKPDVIFHCAAYTAVDKAEKEEDKAYKVNAIGTKNIVEAAKVVDAKIIYISTDYVFDGTKEGQYEMDDETNPQNIYGKTKLQGEKEALKYLRHFIVRISWVFGINGNNFVKTMLKLAETKTELNVVKDQIGSPTYTVDLAELLIAMAQTEKYGIYHATNENYCSWAEFAEYIFKTNNKNVTVNKVTTEEYLKLTGTTQAYRPKNSKLSKKTLEENFFLLPSWEDAINRYSKELQKQKTLEKKGD